MGKNDGGPAFPTEVYVEVTCDHMFNDSHPETHLEKTKAPGMSLRDYFAAKAMQAMITNPKFKDGAPINFDVLKVSVAASAYEYADAMLKARES